MASFKTHYKVGIFAGLSASFMFIFFGILSFTQSIVVFLIVVFGSLLPDIDIPSSKPAKFMFLIITISTISLANFYFIQKYQTKVLIGILFVIFILLQFLLPKILSTLTRHRGVVHSIPMMIVLVFSVSIFANKYLFLSSYLSWIFAISLGYGFFVHLLLDELYSVDILGARLKKSFGSAIKIYDKKELFASAILCIIIALQYQHLPSFTKIREIFISLF